MLEESFLRELELRYGIPESKDMDILTRVARILVSVYNEDKVVIPRPRPTTTIGTTLKAKIGCGTLFVSVNSDNHGICEVFTNTGKGGGCTSQSEATSRLISLALRSGVSIDAITDQLIGIRCKACVRREGVSYKSCPDAIGKALESAASVPIALQEATVTIDPELVATPVVVNTEYPFPEDGIHCPSCGTTLSHQGGCVTCLNCFYSKCG